jgi:hypothetical protein
MNEEQTSPQQDPEQELRETLERIKREGVPYASPEPDSLYWANFRVRLNEKIEAKVAPHGFIERAKRWVVESGIRSGLIGTSLAAIALASVYFGATNEAVDAGKHASPAIVEERPGSVDQVAVADSLIVNEANAVVPENTSALAEAVTTEMADELTSAEAHAAEPLADESAEVGAEPVMLAANGDVPVSLSDLTEAELEAILTSVEQMD